MPITNMGRQLALESQSSATVAGPATVMLVRTGHVFNLTFDWLDSIVGDEIVATGYARQLATFDPVVTQADNRVTRTILATAFGLVGGAANDTVAGCYLFADSGVALTSPLIACVPFETELVTDGTALTVQWPPTTMQQSPSLY